MKKILFLLICLALTCCKDKYEIDFEISAIYPGTDYVISKNRVEKIDASSDREARIAYVQRAIMINNLMNGSSFASGKLFKNGNVINTNLDIETIDSLNKEGEKIHKSLNRRSPFIYYEQLSDSIAVSK